MTNSMLIDYGYRMLEIKTVGLSENAVQQRQHREVRLRSTSEEDDARTVGLTE